VDSLSKDARKKWVGIEVPASVKGGTTLLQMENVEVNRIELDGIQYWDADTPCEILLKGGRVVEIR
jgi:hypothetical protein